MNQYIRGHLVVFDLDGTLSLTDHRNHFIERKASEKDWSAFYDACDKDRANTPVIAAYAAMEAAGFDVQIWTGRSDRVKDKTLTWLAEQGIHSPTLLMRSDGDHTPDVDLKGEWLRDADRKPFLVFEDRARVVEMWRSHGVVCAQVAQGSF